MSINIHRWGSLDPIYFKVTKDGAGVTGLTFDDADIELSKDGNNWAGVSASTTVVEVEAAALYGVYKWTPAGQETEAEVIILNIKEASGTLFDENCLIIQTGGDSNARLTGT